VKPNVSFTQFADKNLQTLSTRNANQDGTISGFLYVPDLNADDTCYNLTKQYVPANVTRTANLPQTDFTLVALAPWINVECTFEYMAAARMAPVRALIFYQPGNDTTTPESSSGAWDLQDGGAWRTHHQFPVYAVPGALGSTLMHQLSLYSGNMTEVPYGHQIAELPDVDVRDYVRLYTEIGLSTKTVFPTLWVYFLVVIAVAVICLGGISGLMHFVQRSRRKSLRRRVANGEIDLEALGIKRLRVPQEDIDRLPLFIYVSEDEKSLPASPQKQEHFVSIDHRDDFSGASTVIGSDSRIYDMMSAKELPTAELVPIDEKAPIPESTLVHRFLPYVQPTCAICLEDFESGISEIRELPCGHIFHPECIDTFLSSNSSLCPMCKKSALPVGSCPTIITNAMVRRERNLRRIRSRVPAQEEPDVEAYGARRRLQDLKANIRRNLMSSPQTIQPLPRQPQPVFVAHPGTGRDQPDALSLELSRQDLVERRIRELQAGQVPIRDPDLVSERHQSKCKSYPLGVILSKNLTFCRAEESFKGISRLLRSLNANGVV